MRKLAEEYKQRNINLDKRDYKVSQQHTLNFLAHNSSPHGGVGRKKQIISLHTVYHYFILFNQRHTFRQKASNHWALVSITLELVDFISLP